MRLFGYGEDALTYVSLTTRLPDVLEQLNDQSQLRDTVVLFRPSFGRKGRTRGGARSSAFGEFDGILGTPAGVYLVEAKWSRSGEVWNKPLLMLRAEQQRRHQVLQWYLAAWRSSEFRHSLRGRIVPRGAPDAIWEAWAAFRQKNVSRFEVAFPDLTIPNAKTGLAENIAFTMQALAGCGEAVRDVLLYADIDEMKCPSLPEQTNFSVVKLYFSDAYRSGFFSMPSAGYLPPA